MHERQRENPATAGLRSGAPSAKRVGIDGRRGIPVVQPYGLPPQVRIFRRMARDHVRMQGGFDVAEDLVVDALGAGHGEHRIAKGRHVVEKLASRVAG